MMKKNRVVVVVVSVISIVLFALSGYAEESPLFAGWEGKWVSSHALNSAPAMEPGFTAIAKAAQGKTVEDVKAFLASMYATDFGAMELAGNAITYYDLDGATVKATCEYSDAGKESTTFTNKDGSKHEFFWYMFALKSGDAACKGYSNLIMTEVHGHEGGLEHWHMRYGEMELDKLMNHPNAMWWPTLLHGDTTVEQALDNTLKNAEEMASMLE
ncbi:MAG: ZinT/AdcA family metal-binding protein [Candidatus Vecturithrix sp.]|nr:ZinT/AdcA family metal-binding protein [Candidatus Vecturithrix sp.]